MISNEIDIDHWRRALAERSRIQIPDFLQPVAAEAFARELAERVPWQLAERMRANRVEFVVIMDDKLQKSMSEPAAVGLMFDEIKVDDGRNVHVYRLR